ncbi:MAG: hypothetical protein ABWY58_14110 [Aeromicrobium sp.]
MNKKLFTLGVGVSAATLALVAGPALATGLSTNVSVGGSSAAGSHPISAASTGTLVFEAEKTAAAGGGYLRMTCASANLGSSPASSVFSGTGLTDIANLGKVNFVTCNGPGGRLTVTTTTNWKLHRTGGTPTAAATDSIPGHIDGVSAHATNAVCTFDVTGKADGTFNESPQQLVVNETAAAAGNLTVSGISGCGGQLLSGGKAKFSGTFNVTSADGVINVLP